MFMETSKTIYNYEDFGKTLFHFLAPASEMSSVNSLLPSFSLQSYKHT